MSRPVLGKFRHCVRCRIYHEAGGHVGCGHRQIPVYEHEEERIEKIISLYPNITRPLCMSENSYVKFAVAKAPQEMVVEERLPPGHLMTPTRIADLFCRMGRDYAGPLCSAG